MFQAVKLALFELLNESFFNFFYFLNDFLISHMVYGLLQTISDIVLIWLLKSIPFSVSQNRKHCKFHRVM